MAAGDVRIDRLDGDDQTLRPSAGTTLMVLSIVSLENQSGATVRLTDGTSQEGTLRTGQFTNNPSWANVKLGINNSLYLITSNSQADFVITTVEV